MFGNVRSAQRALVLILQNEKGEIKDHYVNIGPKDYKDPSSNISAGVRWLIHKFELLRKSHPKADWIDAVAKYKSVPRTDKLIGDFEKYYNQLLKFNAKSG